MFTVTGATGTIGSEVVRLLLDAGAPVRVAVRTPEKAKSLEGRAEIVKADLLEPATLPAAFKGAKKAFVLLGTASDLPRASGPIFQAAEQAGVEHVVFVSSGTIELDPPTTIGNWHLEGEAQLKATKLAWTMLRPGNFASNALRWAHGIKSQGSVFAISGSHKTSVIDPRDIAAVGAKSLLDDANRGKTHVLTGPALISVQEQVDAIGQALGKAVKLVEVPAAGARAGMLKGGMSEQLADALVELQTPGRRSRQPLTTTVKDVTGREARSFADWVGAHLHAFR